MKTRFSLIQPFATLGIILMLSVFFSPHAAAQYDFKSAPAVLGRADASADTNRLLWFSMGCGSGAIGTYLFLLGLESASAEVAVAGGVLGAVPEIMIQVGNAPPPTDRLIGKSPEYVEVYVASYKEEKADIKRGWGILGLLLGSVGGVIIAIKTLID